MVKIYDGLVGAEDGLRFDFLWLFLREPWEGRDCLSPALLELVLSTSCNIQRRT